MRPINGRIRITSESCRDGLHLPVRSSVTRADMLEHACCRFCACDLVRMANSRRWRFSGSLGSEARDGAAPPLAKNRTSDGRLK